MLRYRRNATRAPRSCEPERLEGDHHFSGSERNLGGELSGERFFYFFAHNPLKSPNSAKGIQGNASFFPWFYLDLLASSSTISCILRLDAPNPFLVDQGERRMYLG
jgi:hypothetical protein